MLIEVSWGEVDVRSNGLAGCTFSFVLFDGGGTRGERREGVNVGALLMRADIDLRWPFLGGIVT